MTSLSSSTRLAGFLVPVFALREPNDIGIGNTRAVLGAIDFCRELGFSVLQILPIHDTIGDHSPYCPISSRALSPSLLSLMPEDVPGLTWEDRSRMAPEEWLAELRAGPVQHSIVHQLAMQILSEAHRVFRAQCAERGDLADEFQTFQHENEDWLPDYTLFRLLVHEYEGNANWHVWRPEHQDPQSSARWLDAHPERERLLAAREGLAYMQWIAWRQWKAVFAYAERRGVMLMGELTFGVSRNSMDTWSARELFEFDWYLGTPPIAYFGTNPDSERLGQNWGMPPYHWEAHRATGYRWLKERVRGESQFFHICRLDHLRGYFRAYMFPWPGGACHSEYSQLTEEQILQSSGGRWPRFVPVSDNDPDAAAINGSQGREIIAVIREGAGGMALIAEIMGELPSYIAGALEELRLPNLIFPQLERRPDRSLKPPGSYRALSLVSYANHDHAPLAMLYSQLREKALSQPESVEAGDLQHLLRFAGHTADGLPEFDDDILAAFQRALLRTPCILATLMSSDALGTSLRFNLPGSYGPDTWNQRLEMPLGDFIGHPVFGPRLRTVGEAIRESGRAPLQ